MIDIDTLKTAPVPLLGYLGGGKFIDNTKQFGEKDSATTYWLYQDLGESYYLVWWNNGWVIRFQESFLTKDLKFEHKNDIPSCDFSTYGNYRGWKHVYGSREDAVEVLKQYVLKIRNYEPDDIKRAEGFAYGETQH